MFMLKYTSKKFTLVRFRAFVFPKKNIVGGIDTDFKGGGEE